VKSFGKLQTICSRFDQVTNDLQLSYRKLIQVLYLLKMEQKNLIIGKENPDLWMKNPINNKEI
jgi:argininosuccinate lyase